MVQQTLVPAHQYNKEKSFSIAFYAPGVEN